jgi:hypothetical protein
MSRVHPAIGACAQKQGLVQVVYQFVQDGAPRSVRANVACDQCQLPRDVEEAPFLRCVEAAASAARLPLGPDKKEFLVVFPYRIGVADDRRLDLGWSPMDRGTH